MKHEPITSHTKNYAQQIWLASLGTVGILQKEGSKLFSELVKEGKSIEARSKANGAKRRAQVGRLTETVVAKKESYQKKLETQLKDWDAQIDQLTAKAKKAKGDAQLKVQGEIDSLRSQRAALQNQFDELRNRGEEAWEDLKEGVEKAWSDINDALGKAANHFHETTLKSGSRKMTDR
jgi:poly(hydroxyalkanoate) granule-associated protein